MDDQARAPRRKLGLSAADLAPAAGLTAGARLLARAARPPRPSSGVEPARAAAVEPVALTLSGRRPTRATERLLGSHPSIARRIARATDRPGVTR